MKISSFVKSASLAFVFLAALLFAGCATCCKASQKSQPSSSSSTSFDDVKGRTWQLAQVRNSSGDLTFDASKLDKTKFADVYTLQFNDTLAAGKAAPNRYRAPYALGYSDAISFKQAANTLMLGLYTPEGLNEQQYFELLVNVTRWSYGGNQLLLYNSDGNTLVFEERK